MVAPRTKAFLILVVSLLVGTLYALLVGLISRPVGAGFISWPIWVAIFWFLFHKLRWLRFAGFIAVVPASLLGFELVWSALNPGMNADRHLKVDRSHYTPGLRVVRPRGEDPSPGSYGHGLSEVLIGEDGFRADPQTGKGNPERCRHVLVGDSMIYGSGLPYDQTLRPVLGKMGLTACNLGVSGNSPVDFLATLRYAADKIETGAHVAIYIYAYNDFVSLNKYFSRGFLGWSRTFPGLFQSLVYFDNWRQTTFTHSFFRRQRAEPAAVLWEYDVGKNEPIRLLSPDNPAQYAPPPPLNRRQRAALDIFFRDLTELAQFRSWRVSIVIHPDYPEIFANLALKSRKFTDLDPRRAGGMEACKEFSFVCEDMSGYFYDRAVAEGKSPYFVDNRHFSAFGTRVVAEHYLQLTKRLGIPKG
jgi:hypothetical protein